MAGPVSWQALLLLVSLTVVANATTAIFVGWMVLSICRYLATLERRLQRLEMQMERGAPGAPARGR
jgi:hypothetical protein